MIWFPHRSTNSTLSSSDFQHVKPSIQHGLLDLKQTGVGVFDWCLATNHLQISDSYRHLLGEAANAEMGLLSYIHPEHRSKAAREIRQAASQGLRRFEGMYRMLSSTEKTQVFLLRANLYRDNGQPVRMVGLAIDVTNILKLVLHFGD